MTRLLLDVDTGVDDALAIGILAAHDDAEIVGVCCTAGNVSTARVVQNTLAVLDLFGIAQVPVCAGADVPLGGPIGSAEDVHGQSGLGDAVLAPSARALDPRHAAQLWVDSVRAEPGGIVGLVTGPLTSLALAVKLEPRLPELLAGLVIMGGSFDHRGNVSGAAEWNIFVDPEAAKIVFDAFAGQPESRLPVVCGLNVTERVILRGEHIDEVRRRAGVTDITRFVDDIMRPYFGWYEKLGAGTQAPMHDPLAAVVAVERSLALAAPATVVDVELRGTLTRGMTIADWDGEWSRPYNAVVVTEVDADAVLERIVDGLSRLSAKVSPG
ncbi:nucleoside hydrolase [Microbacterium sp.]|uniref:nucleoside hydrolase n=1 Tax=Microbacterium sp. TaxID=51671 RepID=UPI003F70D5E3